jgi:hypothetical protein
MGRGYLVYTHNGLDVNGVFDDILVSPLNGKIIHYGVAYADPSSNLRSIHIANPDFKVRLLYGRLSLSLAKGNPVLMGKPIGIVQNVAGYHAARRARQGRPKKFMTNHVHMDFWIRKDGVWVRTDPTPYLMRCGVA